MILIVGATGQLGGRVAQRLTESGSDVRALVRPGSPVTQLEQLPIDMVPGDLRDEASLSAAMIGVDTVVSTANAIGRILAGARDVSIADVDGRGNLNLIRAAVGAGVERFVFVSIAGLCAESAAHAPLPRAKWAAEEALRASALREVVVRPDMFQEVWLAPATGIDPRAGKALIYGQGRCPARYVAIDDVAALIGHLAVTPDPPSVVEFGGPDALSRLEVVALFEKAMGRSLAVKHVPRAALSVGQRLLARTKPEIASLMGMALWSDTHPPTWDDTPLREAAIEPRPVGPFIASLVGQPA
jgi:uncharacterized protein YbjT (DUF2867 family)